MRPPILRRNRRGKSVCKSRGGKRKKICIANRVCNLLSATCGVEVTTALLKREGGWVRGWHKKHNSAGGGRERRERFFGLWGQTANFEPVHPISNFFYALPLLLLLSHGRTEEEEEEKGTGERQKSRLVQ